MPIRKPLTLLVALTVPLFAYGCPSLKIFRPTFEDLSRHRIKEIANWQRHDDVPVEVRSFMATDDIVEYLDLDNRLNDFPGEPKAAPMTPALQADIKNAILALPENLRRRMSDRLLGVYAVRGLGSSAYTGFVRNDKKMERFAYVVVDVDAMNRTANEWLTWKENSPFLSDPLNRIEVTIEDKANDTIARALEYVLIHEFGHVLAVNSDLLPPSFLGSGRVDFEDFDFLNHGWTKAPDGIAYNRVIDQQHPVPYPIVYYQTRDGRPPGSAATALYDWLSRTDFVSLYAATNPHDDFAESLVSYVHTVINKRPWEIRVIRDGKVERTVHACWTEPRCAAKRKLLESYLD